MLLFCSAKEGGIRDKNDIIISRSALKTPAVTCWPSRREVTGFLGSGIFELCHVTSAVLHKTFSDILLKVKALYSSSPVSFIFTLWQQQINKTLVCEGRLVSTWSRVKETHQNPRRHKTRGHWPSRNGVPRFHRCGDTSEAVPIPLSSSTFRLRTPELRRSTKEMGILGQELCKLKLKWNMKSQRRELTKGRLCPRGDGWPSGHTLPPKASSFTQPVSWSRPCQNTVGFQNAF